MNKQNESVNVEYIRLRSTIPFFVCREFSFLSRWRIPIGAVAGYAIKKVMKIAAVVVGLFVVGLAYLSYKGWIDVKWVALENATRTTLTNVAGQAVRTICHDTPNLSFNHTH